MVKEQNQNVDKYDIPVWRKYTLSVQEAAKYFHIGDKKLRKLIDENPDAEFILWNGSRPQKILLYAVGTAELGNVSETNM